VNTPVWGGLGMFAVGDTDGELDDGVVVVVAGALDVVVLVVVVVEGLLLALLPHAAVNAPAAMIAATAAAAAMRPAFNPDVMSGCPVVRRLLSDRLSCAAVKPWRSAYPLLGLAVSGLLS
jgi:hypothetical protein